MWPQGKLVADLHVHSVASDGALTPEQLVEQAAAAGLTALALTDHDTIAGVERSMAHGRTRGVEVVPGCELTVYEGRAELHILAFFADVTPGGAARAGPHAAGHVIGQGRLRRGARGPRLGGGGARPCGGAPGPRRRRGHLRL